MLRSISPFLKKFKKLTPPDEALKHEVVRTVEDEVGVSLGEKNIEMQNGVVRIKTTPSVKNEIFIKKEIILEKLSSSFPQQRIKDIR